MKKLFRFLVIISILATFTRCMIYEEVEIEEIKTPEINIDSLIIPPWNPDPNNPDNPSIGH